MRATGLLLAVLAVSCGAQPAVDTTPGTDVTTATTTTTPTSTTRPEVVDVGGLSVIVLPDQGGELPPELLVACPGGPRFPLAALATIRPLEREDWIEAIASFLGNEEGQQWPQENWQILHMTEREVTLVNETGEGNLAYMSLALEGDEWIWAGASISGNPCDLQYTFPEGLNAVDWRLDPTGPALTPESTEVTVVLTERECVSGQEIGDRLVGPQIVMTDTTVRLAFAAEPPKGEVFDCQGNPETSHVVELPEAIGSRVLIEGLEIGISLEDYLD